MMGSDHQTQEMIVNRGDLRPMVSTDVDRVAELEVLCFTTPWPRSAIEEELSSNPRAHYFVYEVGAKLVGYCGFWLILDEGHITNLAIDPEERSKGFAQDMIAQFVREAESRWGGVTDAGSQERKCLCDSRLRKGRLCLHGRA